MRINTFECADIINNTKINSYPYKRYYHQFIIKIYDTNAFEIVYTIIKNP